MTVFIYTLAAVLIFIAPYYTNLRTERISDGPETRPRRDVQILRRDRNKTFVGHETSPRR